MESFHVWCHLVEYWAGGVFVLVCLGFTVGLLSWTVTLRIRNRLFPRINNLSVTELTSWFDPTTIGAPRL